MEAVKIVRLGKSIYGDGKKCLPMKIDLWMSKCYQVIPCGSSSI